MNRLDTFAIPDNKNEIRLFIKLRDEELRLESFLKWYRELGVNRFFFIDNGSKDETINILLAQSDCHVFQTFDSMGTARAGMAWIEPLLEQYGKGQWCLIADADELLVYPDSENKKLSDLCRDLDKRGDNAMRCLMIDMYPDGQVDDKTYSRGEPLIKYSPFFDKDGYKLRPAYEGNFTIRGGPRQRLFYPELMDRSFKARLMRKICQTLSALPGLKKLEPRKPPALNKVPLVKWQDGMAFTPAGHYLSGGQISSTTGALLHFKFLGDFTTRAQKAAQTDAYYNAGAQYADYFAKLDGQTLSFRCDKTMEYQNSEQLVSLGLINR